MKIKRKILMAFFLLHISILSGCVNEKASAREKQADSSGWDMQASEDANSGQDISIEKENHIRKKVIQVNDVGFSRISNRELKITWSCQGDHYIKRYIIKRRKAGETRWQTIGAQVSDGRAGGVEYSFVDTLQNSEPQQYEYRIDIKVRDGRDYEAEKGRTVLASNVLICLDPGPYEGQNVVETEGIRYAEGDFTLELAKEVRRVLEETYGITAYLTRESGTICIGGYTNGELDQGHISMRGEYARGSNLFLSLHTNANLEGANGAAVHSQPIEITKPIIIASAHACDSIPARKAGNAVGNRLAEVNAQMGIALPGKFRSADSHEEMVPWTDAFNDGLENPGTICYRTGQYGEYYGVLRGAADVGVPGMIIEHGFHTVPKMRELAVQGELTAQWAQADAYGIGEGFGMKKKEDL